MKLRNISETIAIITASVLLSACDRGDIDFVQFGSLEGADQTAFNVYASRITDLSKGIPQDCPIPTDIDTKTTSTTINTLIQDLFEYNNKGKVIELSGTYSSMNLKTGEEITLSGKVLLPKDRKPSRYIVVSHYTIGSNAEAPSNIFPLEGTLCNLGYAMIFPDYQGYGVDYEKIHPYLIMDQTAYAVFQMYVSVPKYLMNT